MFGVLETFLNELWHKKHFCSCFQMATAFSHVISVWTRKLTIGLTIEHKDRNVYVIIISSMANTQISTLLLCLLYLLILLSLWLRWANKFILNQRLKRNSASSPVWCVVWRQTHTHFTLAQSLQHWQRAGWVAGPSHLYLHTPSSRLKNSRCDRWSGARHARASACWSDKLCTLRAL